MLNKKLKDLSLGEAIFAGFMTLCVVVSLFCFIMALGIAMSRPAHAAEYVMVPDLKANVVQMEVDDNVCSTVGKLANAMKHMFDRGDSNKDIVNRLTVAALANTDDVNGWIAYNMLGTEKVIDIMRDWTTHKQFKALKLNFPTLTNRELYQAYAGGLCDELVVKNKTVPVLPLKRVLVGTAL